MAIITPGTFSAFGSVNGTTGAKVAGAGFVPGKSATGVYTLTLDGQVDAAECACTATARGTAAFCRVDQTSDGVKTVRTYDAAGAAVDSDFDFVVLHSPAGN